MGFYRDFFLQMVATSLLCSHYGNKREAVDMAQGSFLGRTRWRVGARLCWRQVVRAERRRSQGRGWKPADPAPDDASETGRGLGLASTAGSAAQPSCWGSGVVSLWKPCWEHGQSSSHLCGCGVARYSLALCTEDWVTAWQP